MINRTLALFLILAADTLFLTPSAFFQAPARVNFNWGNVIRESRTSASIEVCVGPPMRRGKPIHDQLFHALHQLGADYVRLSPWHPYPRVAVPELEAPTAMRVNEVGTILPNGRTAELMPSTPNSYWNLSGLV
jgi:hypothetical protein